MFDENESTVMVPTFAIGSFFADRYRIEKLLGSGAMGRVYEAVELHSDRHVALKVLHGERISEVDSVQRFQREAEVLASIGHPCIVEIYTFHKTAEAIPYLAMELLEGVTLKTRLQNAGRFEDPRQLQEIVDGLAGGLAAAHERGIVHRDLKPDNVFLPATGVPRAKLVDFGLSRMQKQDKSLTQSGMIIGTPRYMAPEQIRNASAAGPRGDLYSLGVIIYECLGGVSPYPAQDYGQLLGCLMEGRTTPFQSVRPDLPSFVPFMQRAIAHDPARRFATGGELADAYATAVGVPSRRAEIALQSPKKTERSGRQRVASQSLIGAKGSTLAFDASAARAALEELERGPLPGAPRPFDKTLATPSPFSKEAPWPTEQPAVADLYGDQSFTDPMGEGEMARAAAMIVSADGGPPPSTPTRGSIPDTPVPQDPETQEYDMPLAGYQAQGGDTLFLGNPQPVPLPPASLPGPGPSFSHSVAPGPLPPPRRRRSGFGLILFLVAMLLVVILSALGGFALRAHLRGELEIPGLTNR